jgi:hypothetical protein
MGYDGKYGQVSTERKEIPEDEPVIVIRAQDALACPLITAYFDLCARRGVGPEHQAAVEQTYTVFADWQEAHPDLVKVPDTQPGEYRRQA